MPGMIRVQSRRRWENDPTAESPLSHGDSDVTDGRASTMHRETHREVQKSGAELWSDSEWHLCPRSLGRRWL